MSTAATNKTFTLGDLTKIAMGASELNSDHLSVLRSIFTILLQKLNCHHEVVRIGGFPAKCIQKLLSEQSHTSQFDFQLKNIKGFQEKYKLLEELESKYEEIHSKLEQHFEQIRSYHKTDTFTADKWDLYSSPTEDLCTLYRRSNKEFCLLAQNVIFSNELRSRVVPLVMERFQEFEDKIDQMQNKLRDITQVAEKNATKLKCIEFVIKDIECLRSLLKTEAVGFRETMKEVQEMLNCKLHRVTLPALRKYLEERFVVIRQQLSILKKESIRCFPTEPLKIQNKKTCLSCSRHQELKSVKKLKNLKSIDEEEKCHCRDLLREPTILDKMDRIQYSHYAMNASAFLVQRVSVRKRTGSSVKRQSDNSKRIRFSENSIETAKKFDKYSERPTSAWLSSSYF